MVCSVSTRAVCTGNAIIDCVIMEAKYSNLLSLLEYHGMGFALVSSGSVLLLATCWLF